MKNKFDFCKFKTVEDSLRWYQQGGFYRLNSFLWRENLDHKDGLYKQLQNIDILKVVAKDAMNLSSIVNTAQVETRVFRGTNDSFFDISEFKIGSTISLRGFTSTSKDYVVAKNFGVTKKSTEIIFDICIPKGGKIVPIHGAEFDHEKEILLPPANYEVVEVSKTQNGKYYIVLKQKEMLDIPTLIDEGFDYVTSNLPKHSFYKKNKILHLKKRVQRYADYERKNPKINILTSMQPPNFQQDIVVNSPNTNDQVEQFSMGIEQQLESQSMESEDDGMEM